MNTRSSNSNTPNGWVSIKTLTATLAILVTLAIFILGSLASIQAGRDNRQDLRNSEMWKEHLADEREESRKLEVRLQSIDRKLDRIIDRQNQ